MREVPLHPGEENPDQQQQSEPNAIPFTADSRVHVLVVEDQPQMARMIAATLTKLYNVTIASDGQEGLEQALALRPDIILCDVLMPRMNGEQLVALLRAQPDFDDVPIVVLSGRTDEQLRIQLLRAGAQDFLVKPFHYEELRIRVANQLMMRHVRQMLQQEVTQQSHNLADMVKDVVERKRESEQVVLSLQESEANFRMLANVMPQIVWTARPDGRLDYYNQRWFDYTGMTPEQTQDLGWRYVMHPDDLQKCLDVWTHAVETGESHEMEYRFKRASDGIYRWHLGRTSSMRDSHGTIIKWFGTSTDIDDQKRIEETLRFSETQLQEALHLAETNYRQLERTQSQLRAIIDASQEAMLFLKPDGRPIKVNRRFTSFFGLDDTTVLSQSPDQLITLLKGLFEAADSLDQWSNWSTTDQEHIFREQLVQMQPAPREFDLTSLPVINVDQAYLGRLYVWHDVTHEREVDRMKSEFVSLVSHELRTPLTSIQGYIDLLLSDDTVGELTELQREFLGIAQNNSRRLVNITNDLLDLSRIESGKMELRRVPLNLNLLIGDLMHSFQPAWALKRQTFTLRLPESAPMALGDADRVTQILTNLLSNAHKYTPEEGHIDLSVETDGTVARISITDSGIGLSTGDQAKLFTRFYRVPNAATQAGGGTGLGLVITRSLVEMQGGKIQVTSEPGRGSTFSFTLPLSRPLELPTSPQELQPGRRILVVDDEPDIRRLLQHYLEGADYEVMMASTGEEAFQLARIAQPDLITLDILLPDSSGLTVLERLKSDAATASIPVIMLTIVKDDGQGRLLGATDYLDKPIAALDLLQRIATVFTDQSQQRLILLVAAASEQNEPLVLALQGAGHKVMIVPDGRKLLALARRAHPDLIIFDAAVPPMGGLALLQALRADPDIRTLPVIMTGTQPGELGMHWHTLTPIGYVDIWGNPGHVEAIVQVITQRLKTGTSAPV
jgi:PAS domain S-box-containing protein